MVRVRGNVLVWVGVQFRVKVRFCIVLLLRFELRLPLMLMVTLVPDRKPVKQIADNLL